MPKASSPFFFGVLRQTSEISTSPRIGPPLLNSDHGSTLYLDQNAWVALARAALDKSEHPSEHAILSR